MSRDLEIADRQRAWGLMTTEVDGWRTRGKDSFAGRILLWHHTAGSASGNSPSLGICVNGRSDLPGPLCHALQARDDNFYVIASGAANHGGKGEWAGISGNSKAWGLEIELQGTAAEPLTPARFTNACRWAAAMIEGRSTVDLCCEHYEYALPLGRKSDVYGWTGAQFRDQTVRLLAGTTPIEEDDMYAVSLKPDGVGAVLPVVGNRSGRKLVVDVDAGNLPASFRIVPLAGGIVTITDPWTVQPWSRGEYLLPNGTTHVRVVMNKGGEPTGIAEAHVE